MPIKIKLIKKVGKFEVWLVDGAIIRKSIDADFTNFSQHLHNKYVPINEFWIDNNTKEEEWNFFITHLLAEYKAMSQGKKYEDALDIADRAERADRFKSKKFKKAPKDYSKLIKKIKIKKIATFGNLTVWLVNGELIRDFLYTDFVEGGHFKVYDWVPDGEIFIESAVIGNERFYILLHEIFECRLMLAGLKYNDAHEKATKLEWLVREM